MPRRFDPDTTEEPALERLAAWLAFELPRRAGPDVWRRLIPKIHRLHERRGTVSGVRELCELYTGARWTLASAGASKQLYGVSFGDDMVGYAVGIDGTGAVLRSDNGGGSWQVQTSNSQFRLNDVFFIDAQRGWAVGNNGTIIHTARGGLN
jgi:hypothetical protein